MVKRDHELRLSPTTQARYLGCGDDAERKESVTRAVQRRVAREAGFTGSTVQDGVELLQSCTSLFPNDAELRSAAFYLANNIHVPCPLKVGACVPADLPLYDATEGARPTTLGALISCAPLTVICAGSAT